MKWSKIPGKYPLPLHYFIRRGRQTRENFYSLIHCPQRPSMVQAVARCWTLRPGLSCEWQEPSYLEPPLLPLRVRVRRKLELATRAEYRTTNSNLKSVVLNITPHSAIYRRAVRATTSTGHFYISKITQMTLHNKSYSL